MSLSTDDNKDVLLSKASLVALVSGHLWSSMVILVDQHTALYRATIAGHLVETAHRRMINTIEDK